VVETPTQGVIFGPSPLPGWMLWGGEEAGSLRQSRKDTCEDGVAVNVGWQGRGEHGGALCVLLTGLQL